MTNRPINTFPNQYAPPPYEMILLNSRQLIYPREIYQRGLQDSRAARIADDFNEYVANEPKVSFRGGKYYVFDGQHTVEARKLLNGGKDLYVLCKVYTGLTEEQEARLFAIQTGIAAPLTAGIKLRANVFSGEPISEKFLRATQESGLTIDYSQQYGDYRIGCVGTALSEYKRVGETLYRETLQIIVEAWEGQQDSLRAEVLIGMMRFVELYHGEFDRDRLIRTLKNIHPISIYRDGQANLTGLPGYKKYLLPIYRCYNGKSRKNSLPLKF